MQEVGGSIPPSSTTISTVCPTSPSSKGIGPLIQVRLAPEMSSKPPFFIFGCPRSGTSLLSRILNSHSRFCVPFETNLYRTFWPWRRFYRGLTSTAMTRAMIGDFASTWAAAGQQLDEADALSRVVGDGFHAVVDGIMTSLTAMEGKEHWGEKTPYHAFYFDHIREGFPQAKFIHIVRDGRDCALSWKNARFGPKHLYVAGQRWQAYVEGIAPIAASLPEAQFLELTYEQLLGETDVTMQKVCEFLDEVYEPEMLSFYNKKQWYPTDRTNQENLSKPLMNDNFDKWKRCLTEREILDIEAGASRALLANGYDLHGNGDDISATRRFAIKYLLHPLYRFRSMAKNREGHGFSLNKSAVYFRLRTRYWLGGR